MSTSHSTARALIIAFRRERLERYIRLFLAEKFTTIHGAPMVGRRDWLGSMDMLLGVRAADGQEVYATSERGKHMMTEMGTRVVAMMKENHWEAQWLQGIFDEPTDEFVDRYKELVALFREWIHQSRSWRQRSRRQLLGDVNVWCPQVQEYQARPRVLRRTEDRRETGSGSTHVSLPEVRG